MKIKEEILTSLCDQVPISVAYLVPTGKIKGILQIVHGMAEHKERYYTFMEYLEKLGFASVICDNRGHGKSVLQEDDLGYFYEEKANFIIEDLHSVTTFIKNLIPEVPITLFGHSMGSMLVRKYVKTYDYEIDKLIVCGSPSKNSFAFLGIALAKFLSIFKGGHYRSSFIDFLAFGSFDKYFPNEGKNAWICSSKSTVDAYQNDTLCGFTFTLNGFLNLFHMMQDIYSKKGWLVKNPTLPIYFIAGSDDKVILSKEKWEDSQNFLKQIGYFDISNKLYPHFRHELLNEEGHLLVYEDIMKFLEK